MRRWRIGAAIVAASCALPLGAGAAEPHRPPTPGFADLVERLMPAVVNIATVHEASAPTLDRALALPPGLSLDDLFRDLLERQRKRAAESPPVRREMLSLGSGFVIDPAGWIVTNQHVVAGGSRIRVTLSDGSMLAGRLVGQDARMDLALVKVEPRRPLRAVAWGSSDGVRPGDWVMTIGNPFGLVNSVAAGIVSGRDRDLHSGPEDDYIQTDAAMNTGSSGGPMFDMSGRVIGIDTAIYTQTGGSVGVGFAIPSSLAQPVVEQLKRYGKVTRGFIGVSLQSVTGEIAQLVSLDRPRGALITRVLPGGPAAAAQLMRGDVIVSVGGTPIDTVHRLQHLIEGLPIDQPVELVVWRDRHELPLAVRIGALPDEHVAKADDAAPAVPSETAAPTSGTAAPRAPANASERLGLVLGPITQEARQAEGLREPGVAVTDVVPSSPADDAGLSAGDLILALDGSVVATPEDATRRLQQAAGTRKPVLMLVERDGERRFVAVRTSAS
ncbi:MAG TPA: trypsin-like peptidase domain-containing protein [Candidatus Sulfotelmatobacter sp.]|nr:trypsin-like peptidase domain-containing protein [Candidatus Sulfotelmatobacter sp.]